MILAPDHEHTETENVNRLIELLEHQKKFALTDSSPTEKNLIVKLYDLLSKWSDGDASNFYKPIDLLEGMAAHEWMQEKFFPHDEEESESHDPVRINETIEILQLIESLAPPSINYFLDRSIDIFSNIKHPIPFTQNLNLEFRASRKNGPVLVRDLLMCNFDRNDRYSQYITDFCITDKKEEVLYSFYEDLPNGSSFCPNFDEERWAASEKYNVVLYPYSVLFKKWDPMNFMSLVHEIGHIQQKNDLHFTNKWEERHRKQFQEKPTKDMDCEADAWRRENKIISKLRRTEEERGITMLPNRKKMRDNIHRAIGSYRQYFKQL